MVVVAWGGGDGAVEKEGTRLHKVAIETQVSRDGARLVLISGRSCVEAVSEQYRRWDERRWR